MSLFISRESAKRPLNNNNPIMKLALRYFYGLRITNDEFSASLRRAMIRANADSKTIDGKLNNTRTQMLNLREMTFKMFEQVICSFMGCELVGMTFQVKRLNPVTGNYEVVTLDIKDDMDAPMHIEVVGNNGSVPVQDPFAGMAPVNLTPEVQQSEPVISTPKRTKKEQPTVVVV